MNSFGNTIFLFLLQVRKVITRISERHAKAIPTRPEIAPIASAWAALFTARKSNVQFCPVETGLFKTPLHVVQAAKVSHKQVISHCETL
jgi:hypothetical protein